MSNFRYPTLIAYWVSGVVLFLAVAAIIALSVKQIIDVPDSQIFTKKGARTTADAASRVFWGAVVLVNGVYLCRAATRRGWRDRLGRLLIAGGYVVVAVAMSRFIHMASDQWSGATKAANSLTTSPLFWFVAIGAPGAFLVWCGVHLANEKVLLTASASEG